MNNTTAPATLRVGMTRYGKKIHRISGDRVLCDANDRNASGFRKDRNSVQFVAEIANGELPEGVLCSKCFANVDADAPRVAIIPEAPAAPVRPAAPVEADPRTGEMVTYAEAFEMIEAAGLADYVGGRDAYLGENNEFANGTTDRGYVLDFIATTAA